MKKILFILSLVAVTSLTAFAQRPVAGAKGFTFGLDPIFSASNSLNSGPARTGSLLFRYYVADGLAARVSLNYSKSSTKTTDTSTTAQTTETQNSNSTFAIQLGAQKSLGEGEKLEPYIGADFYFAKSSGKFEGRTDYAAGHAFRAAGDFDEITADGRSSGGFGAPYNAPSTDIGFIPMVGFNYFFTENFAIGAEFGWGFIISSSNDNVTETDVSKSGAVTTTTTNYYNTQTKTTTFDTRGNNLITVSVFF